jgi:CPA1 family monovalent cation:H+ antiporter
VLGILKSANAPAEIEAIIAGESLFNDGVGVVVFLVLTAIAGLQTAGGIGNAGGGMDAPQVALLFGREVGGGIVLGLGLGWIAYQALKSIDEYKIEVQITLALVMLITVLAGVLHLSGPIAVVLAGLLLGNHGRQFAMSPMTIEHVETFWELVDEILNAVLFLLLGLEVFAISLRPAHLAAGALMIPLALGARFVAVGLPVQVLSRIRRPLPRGTVSVLTWSGLRGGISVALVLSLPAFPGRDTILTVTYVVVLFSILAQGLTVRRVVTRLLGPAPGPSRHGVV